MALLPVNNRKFCRYCCWHTFNCLYVCHQTVHNLILVFVGISDSHISESGKGILLRDRIWVGYVVTNVSAKPAASLTVTVPGSFKTFQLVHRTPQYHTPAGHKLNTQGYVIFLDVYQTSTLHKTLLSGIMASISFKDTHTPQTFPCSSLHTHYIKTSFK
jgi:hypothetical protein